MPPNTLARLQGLLPSGYSPGSCTAAQPPAKALAAMTCTTNTDPGGAGPAVYAITRGPAELRTALNESLRAVAVVTCPGNIQSPGPWRRNATPQQVSGTGLWPAQRRSDHRFDYRSRSAHQPSGRHRQRPTSARSAVQVVVVAFVTVGRAAELRRQSMRAAWGPVRAEKCPLDRSPGTLAACGPPGI